MPLPLIAGAIGTGLGVASEKFGWTFIPNYKDIPTVLAGNDSQLEKNAFNMAKILLVEEEGKRNDVYKDSRGILTVGIGHKVLAQDNLKLGQVISDSRVDSLFQEDINTAFNAAIKQAKQINRYNALMIARLTSVNFQLGTGWVNVFPNTWALIKNGSPDEVQKAIKNITTPKYENGQPANWVAQTPNRALAFAQTLRQQFLT